jgi:hypothetical protein
MRWLELAALVMVATGCTVHVVERPAVPVVVALPAQPAPYVRVAARPAFVEPAAHPPRAPRARPSHPPGLAARRAVPREPRPKHVANVRPKEPGHRTPQKEKRSGRFKLERHDVAPIETEPARPSQRKSARSTSVAKAQKNALDLRQ